MTKAFIEVTAIDRRIETEFQNAQQSARGEFREVEFSEDDLEQPIDPDATPTAVPTSSDSTSAVIEPSGLYSPMAVFVNDIREMYPRKGNRSGTRIVYRSGAFRLVKETYAEVKAKFEEATAPAAPARAPRVR